MKYPLLMFCVGNFFGNFRKCLKSFDPGKVFVWLLPCFPTNCQSTTEKLCKILATVHKVNETFYHWSWYIFPRILEHYTYMDEAISFLMTAAQNLNASPHIWEGHPDGELDSLGRRPRPILQESVEPNTVEQC